jgi:phage baseplate assembly protein W
MNYKRTLRVTSEGDIATPNKKAEFLDGPTGAVQELKILLSTIRGEDPFAPEHGLRLFEAVGTSDAILEREIRIALQGDDRVESVDDVEINRDSSGARVADVTVTVTLVDQDQVQFSAEVG